jgi:hypothetical protein
MEKDSDMKICRKILHEEKAENMNILGSEELHFLPYLPCIFLVFFFIK